ncbi:alcohol dehydrogenase catalytic domain-containing protein [Paenibacillus sp. S3N08]|uniref:Alcohol dehydrogenase catalytic domain-containing protein n=2 Tax=Paenibacillus agricola TaxID=2716264 RepID=A0ABX0IXM2_9BACL|nr:alcohol dehydrogenase catalytic domain-containing protein [Paenibacillus agricola]
MKALVYEGPRSMSIREQPLPVLGENEVLVQVAKAGICGSELSGYLGHNSLRKPPLVMGHEFSGTVVQVGARVQGFRGGERVTVNPLISCGLCTDCLTGKQQLCGSRQLIGAHRPGAFAEYVAVPAGSVHCLPEGVTFAEGALTEPLACALHVCRLLQLTPEVRLLITGAGPIGLFILTAAQAYGLNTIVVTDINSERLDAVKALGGVGVSALAPDGVRPGSFDAAVDAVGIQATRLQCVRALKPGGRLVFTGLHEAGAVLPINEMIRNEIQTAGAFAYSPRDFELSLKWIGEGKASLLPWTVTEKLEEGAACFEKLLDNPGPIAKILLHMEDL